MVRPSKLSDLIFKLRSILGEDAAAPKKEAERMKEASVFPTGRRFIRVLAARA